MKGENFSDGLNVYQKRNSENVFEELSKIKEFSQGAKIVMKKWFGSTLEKTSNCHKSVRTHLLNKLKIFLVQYFVSNRDWPNEANNLSMNRIAFFFCLTPVFKISGPPNKTRTRNKTYPGLSDPSLHIKQTE